MEAVAASGSCVMGPLARQPGWDFYDIETADLVRNAGEGAQSAGAAVLHVRRTAPIHLVRIYSCWLSGEPPLASVARPEGTQATEVRLPASAKRLPRLLVAVCPPAPKSIEALAGDKEFRSSVPRQSSLTATTEWSSLGVGWDSTLRRANSGYLHGSYTARPSISFRVSAAERLIAKLQAQAAELTSELNEQRLARRNAEAERLGVALELSSLRQEREELTRRLRCAERTTMERDMQVRALTSELAKMKGTQRTGSRSGISRCADRMSGATCLEDVVSSLVNLELQQLGRCTPQDRAAMKKRLLLRWHPDKNSGGGRGCGDFATRVMQEMQCHPEWSY